jgi:hypothetical protein
MNDRNQVRHKIAAVAKRLAVDHKQQLDESKAWERHLDRADFLWHFLLQSFGTMGRATGWVGLSRPENYQRLTYEALAALQTGGRRAVAEQVCREAKVRMPSKKAGYIAGCFDRIARLGGPKAAKDHLLRQPGREAKIKFLKSLPGIGDKYARNILMDVYHPDFRDSIAVDARIKSLSKELGLAFASYADHEQFYLDVARDAGLNGWELDRLIFNFLDDFRSALGLN